MFRISCLSLAPIALLALASPALAEDAGHIEYRQKLMSGIGADMGAISDVLKYQLPVTGNLAGHAASLANHADLIAAAFEKQVTEGPTDAKTEVWSDWAGFEKAIASFRKEAEALTAAAESGDMAAFGLQLRAVGKSCSGCHKGYRKPKEESYKNQ